MNFGFFNVMFIVVGIIAVGIFVFCFLLIFSPKIRGKMMSKHVKSTKYMMDESKDDIKSISTDMAEATEDAVEITTRAIKRGTQTEKNFCKHCGQKLDKDAKFCSKCGKEL